MIEKLNNIYGGEYTKLASHRHVATSCKITCSFDLEMLTLSSWTINILLYKYLKL